MPSLDGEWNSGLSGSLVYTREGVYSDREVSPTLKPMRWDPPCLADRAGLLKSLRTCRLIGEGLAAHSCATKPPEDRVHARVRAASATDRLMCFLGSDRSARPRWIIK